jgi:hypothetical protein
MSSATINAGTVNKRDSYCNSWDMTPCSYNRYPGTCCDRLEGKIVYETHSEQSPVASFCEYSEELSAFIKAGGSFGLHGGTSQEIVTFIKTIFQHHYNEMLLEAEVFQKKFTFLPTRFTIHRRRNPSQT